MSMKGLFGFLMLVINRNLRRLYGQRYHSFFLKYFSFGWSTLEKTSFLPEAWITYIQRSNLNMVRSVVCVCVCVCVRARVTKKRERGECCGTEKQHWVARKEKKLSSRLSRHRTGYGTDQVFARVCASSDRGRWILTRTNLVLYLAQ